MYIITNVIHYNYNEKSDWSREFNQYTTKCELDNGFIMSTSKSAWSLSPSSVECAQTFVNSERKKIYHKTIIEFSFRKTSCLTSSDNYLISFVRFNFYLLCLYTFFFCKNVYFCG